MIRIRQHIKPTKPPTPEHVLIVHLLALENTVKYLFTIYGALFVA